MPTVGEPKASVPKGAEVIQMIELEDYANLLARLWATGEDFAIIEHDIVTTAVVFEGFALCDEPYCGHRYNIGRKLGGTLGCVRWQGDFTSAYPGVAVEVAGTPWDKLDGVVAAAMSARGYDDYHVHEPPLVHLHEYEAGKPTADPTTLIEEQREGYVRYRSITEGRRWEVHGTCDRRGDCLVGAVIDGKELTRADIDAASERLVSALDVPVTPEFEGCCPFTFTELESA